MKYLKTFEGHTIFNRAVDNLSSVNPLDAIKDMKPNEMLIQSCKHGFLPGVKLAIESGANIHYNNDAPILYSSLNGHIDVVKYLVEGGANVRTNDDYALRWASYYGHLDVVKFLVERGADIHSGDDYPLRYSSYNGHIEVVKYLIQMGADIHVSDGAPLINAIHSGHTEVAKYLKSKMGLNEGFKPSKIYKKIIFNDYIILIGKNAQSNDILTFQVAEDNDIFLHVSGVPGSHVIIKSKGEDVPIEVIEYAAKLAFENSKAQGESKVVYTQRKNVYKNNEHKIGQVSVDYDKSKFIYLKI